jgi:methylmalonyl-CoA mutase N-terminal domain/subunit
VESLTDEMEARAEETFAHLDDLGGGAMLEGVLRGIEEGWFQDEIADAAYRFDRAMNQHRRVMVGVNGFTEGNAEDPIEVLKITDEDERRQIKRLGGVKSRRDQAAVDRALRDLATAAADPDTNLMEPLIDTVRTYATLGGDRGWHPGLSPVRGGLRRCLDDRRATRRRYGKRYPRCGGYPLPPQCG